MLAIVTSTASVSRRRPVAVLLALAASLLSSPLASAAPPTPVLNGTSPASPANNNNPLLLGSTGPAAVIRVYSGVSCQGQPIASGKAGGTGTFAISLQVANNTVSTFSARASDSSGVSACSAPLAYVEKSTPPPVPNLSGTSPPSPADNNHPLLLGSTGPNAMVRVFATLGCQGSAVAAAKATGAGSFSLQVSVKDNSVTTFSARASDVGGTSACSAPVTYVEGSILPLDRTVATTTDVASAWLYTGSAPRQTGVTIAALDPQRTAVLRGRVSALGAPLEGVTITIPGHPEFGTTMTQDTGWFDMVVNGGGLITVMFEKTGYLPVRRQVQTTWLDYARVPDVVLTAPDVPTAVNLATGAAMQGSLIPESCQGIPCPHRATLLFQPGTTAQKDGLPLGPDVTVRATEYTVGPDGPKAMPATLPSNSGYTYAVEYSIDEAAGATAVTFNQPVFAYVENFLGFPVGTKVPVGYYDKAKGAWVASEDGRVIEIIGVTNGKADIDSGSGPPLGMSDNERAQLATLYTQGKIGQTLWRTPVMHFSSWDCNWPFGPPGGAGSPPGGGGGGPGGGGGGSAGNPGPDPQPDDPCNTDGSIIECESQALGVSQPIVGTPYRLHYTSDRTVARKSFYSLKIPLSGATLPPGVKRIEASFDVGGRTFDMVPKVCSPSCAPNDEWKTGAWDGTDVYGRRLQGAQPVTVRVGYVYTGVYYNSSASPGFAKPPNGTPITGSLSRQEVTLWTLWKTQLGTWVAQPQRLGGWSISAHHAYDPVGRRLYLGDGRRRSAAALEPVLSVAHFASPQGYSYGGLAVAPDGSVYFVSSDSRIKRRATDGTVTTIAGTGLPGFNGDGPATSKNVTHPSGLALGADGAVYFTETTGSHRVRKIVGTDLITLAGDGTTAVLNDPQGLAVAGDGTVYVADHLHQTIRRIGPDGILTTIAGTTDVIGDSGTGGLATQALLRGPTGLALGPDGSIYFSEEYGYRVRRIGNDGVLTLVAGTPLSAGSEGDGLPATSAKLTEPWGLAVSPDGTLYIADASRKVRRVDPSGIITTVAGGAPVQLVDGGVGGPAARAWLNDVVWVAVAPSGDLYVLGANTPIWRVSAALPRYSATGNIAVASEDGREVYVFDPFGRHLTTRDPLTGVTTMTFGYTNGLLTTITDVAGRTTTILRDANGDPADIKSPYNQLTHVTMTVPGGFLSTITNPKNESVYLGYYDTDGLLHTLVDAKGQGHTFDFDLTTGLLLKDTNDLQAGYKQLAKTELPGQYSVTVTSPVSASILPSRSYSVQRLSNGSLERTTIKPDGVSVVTTRFADGTSTTTHTDGTVITRTRTGDPRFGLQVPITDSTTVTTGGITREQQRIRTVTLSDPSDPFSLQGLVDKFKVRHNLAWNTTTRAYNAATRTTTTTTQVGRTSAVTLDASGRLSKVKVTCGWSTCPQGLAEIQYSYYPNPDGALWKITKVHPTDSNKSRQYELLYDPSGNLQFIYDPNGVAIAQIGYDAAARVTSILTPLPMGTATTAFDHDANGNLTLVQPPGKPNHTFGFTAADQVNPYTPPTIPPATQIATTYTYTLDRRRDVTAVPNLQGDGIATIDNDYDSMGRLGSVSASGGAIPFAVSFGYAPSGPEQGKLTAVTGPGPVNLMFGYAGQLRTDTQWDGVVANVPGHVHVDYDDNFRVLSESINGAASIGFGYDNDGLLVTAGAISVARSADNGWVTGSTLTVSPNTIVDGPRTYTAFGEPLVFEAKRGAVPLLKIEYTNYDKRGRLVDKTETILGVVTTFHYEYDAAGRLRTAASSNPLPALNATYTYDSNGNRTGAGWGAPDNQDRLTTSPYGTYTYGANGELYRKLVGDQLTTYTYDLVGNLRQVQRPGNAAAIEYLVDGLKRRVGKRVGGQLQSAYLYRGDRLIAELDGAGNVVARYVYATRRRVPDYMTKNGSTYRIVTDHLGSVRLVVKVEDPGTVAQQLLYDPWGKVLSDSAPGFQPFGFAGGLYDPDTGLVRFGARDYDAEVGRWTAKDPLRFGGRRSNLYAYVGGDPVNRTDSRGTADEEFCKHFRQQYIEWCVDDCLNRSGVTIFGEDGFGLCGDYTLLDNEGRQSLSSECRTNCEDSARYYYGDCIEPYVPRPDPFPKRYDAPCHDENCYA